MVKAELDTMIDNGISGLFYKHFGCWSCDFQPFVDNPIPKTDDGEIDAERLIAERHSTVYRGIRFYFETCEQLKAFCEIVEQKGEQMITIEQNDKERKMGKRIRPIKQIQLTPYKPKNIETTMAGGETYGDIYYHQNGGVKITYWKCKSFFGRLLFLFNGKIELKQICTKLFPQAICINNPESNNQ